jgi:predicted restriction endonuclease
VPHQNEKRCIAYVNRGKAFSKLNYLREAEEDWKRALEIDSSLKERVSKLSNTIEFLDSSEDSPDENYQKRSHHSEEQETDSQTDESNILSAQETETLNNRFGDISEKERETVIQAGRGQGLFRNQVIEYWSTCAVTGCAEHSLLRASHIKPWAKCNLEEALDPFNGLLLSPSLDAAFDAGYISFDNAGKILISQYLSQSDAQILGIFSSLRLSKIHSKHQQYLVCHRQNIFKG